MAAMAPPLEQVLQDADLLSLIATKSCMLCALLRTAKGMRATIAQVVEDIFNGWPAPAREFANVLIGRRLRLRDFARPPVHLKLLCMREHEGLSSLAPLR